MSDRGLIVDDHAGFRASARRLLEGAGFTVVGEAADGTQALRLAEELRPDLVLVDIHLPDADGRYVAGRISAGHGAPDVVLISSRYIDHLGDSVERAGARVHLESGALGGDAVSIAAMSSS